MTLNVDRETAERIEANVERVVFLSKDWARHMAARLNARVYLVGSTLHAPEPRDCDIRLILLDHEFAARYGMPMVAIPVEMQRERNGVTRTSAVPFDEGVTQRWVDDIAKLGAALSLRLHRNVDVKVWPDSYWREPYPTPVLLAAPSPHVFHYNAYAPDPSLPLDALPEPPPKTDTGTVPESSLSSTDDESPLARAREGGA